MPTNEATANRVVLGANIGATGTGAYMAVAGGAYILAAEGTFGATTLTLSKKGPNDTPVAVPGVSMTVAGADIGLDIAAGTEIAYVLTGGAPPGMYISLTKVT